MTKMLGSILLAGVIISLTSCSENTDLTENDENDSYVTTAQFDYPEYDTAESLVNSADLIFSGTVENISYEEIDVRADQETNSISGSSASDRMPYTIYTINVTQIYKGETEEDTISIKVPGGEISENLSVTEVSENVPSIVQGRAYLFLTETYENSYPSLINMTQAVYELNAAETHNKAANTITSSQIIEILE